MNKHRSTQRYVFIAVSLPHLAESGQHACASITEQGEIRLVVMLLDRISDHGRKGWGGVGCVIEGDHTQNVPAMQLAGTAGDGSGGMNPFLMLLMDHHVSCFNGRLHV